MKILITGVTRGLGLALAKKFMALGHTVIGCGRSGTEIFDLRMDHGSPHDFMVCDVGLDAKVAIWAAKALEHESPPDILINNAGVMNPLGPLWEQSDREFTKIVDVNLRGVANVIRHFVPAMVAKKRGVIVNLSSGWGRGVARDVAPYCGTKWAIEGLTGRTAGGDGCGAVESRRDRYGHATGLLGGRGGGIPQSRGLGRGGGAIHSGTGAQGQWQEPQRGRI